MMAWFLTSSVLILAVILLRAVLKGKIGLRLQYSLWLLVLIRLLIPGSLFASSISILNSVEFLNQQPVPETTAVIDQIDIPTQSHADDDRQVVQSDENQGIDIAQLDLAAQEIIDGQITQARETISLPQLLCQIWIAGMALVGIWLLIVNLSFRHKLRSSRKLLDFTDANLPVYHSNQVSTPCLFGLLRPAVYLTDDVTETALPHVLSHELTHYRHGDHIWSFLRSVCLVLHWYNPLVWWAAALSRRDSELACDEGAIRRLGEAQRIAYGRTLIGMTCSGSRDILLTATTMVESKKSLKERIALIAKHPKTAVFTLIAVICIAGIAVGCTFTGAKQSGNSAALAADRVEIRLFGSDVVQTDLTDAQIEMLTDLYHSKTVTQTNKPVGDAARLEITFYDRTETAAVWTVTPDVCAATDLGNFIWENSEFDTIWELYWQAAPVDGGFITNLLMSSLPPRLSAEDAQSVLARFRSMDLTGTTNEPDWVNSLCVQLTSGDTPVLCFEIDQKGEVMLFETQSDRLNRTNGHYYMCENGEAFYQELEAMFNGEQQLSALEQLTLDYIQDEIAYYENDCGYTVLDHELVSLTQLTSPDQSAEAWLLEYRLQMADPDSVILAGGMELTEDGKLTEQGSMGRPVLMLYRAETQLIPLGITWTLAVQEDFGGDYDRCAQNALTDYAYRTTAGEPSYDALHAILTLPVVDQNTALPSVSWSFKLSVSYEASETNDTYWEPGASVRLSLDNATAAWLTPIRTDAAGISSPGTPIDLLPMCQAGTPLSQETLDELTVWLSQDDNYGFLLSEYEDVRDVSLHEVFYSGAGLTEYGTEDHVQQAMAPAYTDITCLRKDDMDALLLQRTGYGLSEMRDPLEYWTYLEEYGLYAHEHGDTNLNRYVCTGGYRAVTGTELYVVNYRIVYMWFNHTADGGTYLSDSGTVVLQKVQNGYRFVANSLHPASD